MCSNLHFRNSERAPLCSILHCCFSAFEDALNMFSHFCVDVFLCRNEIEASSWRAIPLESTCLLYKGGILRKINTAIQEYCFFFSSR